LEPTSNRIDSSSAYTQNLPCHQQENHQVASCISLPPNYHEGKLSSRPSAQPPNQE